MKTGVTERNERFCDSENVDKSNPLCNKEKRDVNISYSYSKISKLNFKAKCIGFVLM